MRLATRGPLLMRANPHATFLVHDCIPSKTKVELFGLQRGITKKRKTFIQCFENAECFAECIAIDIFDVLFNE